MARSYRDCKAWQDEGMKLNTTNNETCKMYDAAIKQMCTRQDDPNVGGTEGALEKMLQSDPNFVMGHVYRTYTGVFGGSGGSPSLEELEKAQWPNLSAMERSHCKAARYQQYGQGHKAIKEWESILNNHPRDYLALKMLYETQLTLGEFEKQREDVAKVLPFYNKKTDIEYGYVVGMHAFSLQETGFYDAAEKKAREALSLNRKDAWSTHSMAHVFDVTGRFDEGIEFISKTRNDWETVSSLATHHHWHNILYYIEKGDIEGALAVYDSELAPSVRGGAMFPVSDAAGTLYRLKMMGVDAGKKRWKDLGTVLPSHMHDHGWAFYDATVMLGLCGAGMHEQSKSFLKSIKKLASKPSSSDVNSISKSVNQYICEAVQYYEDEKYQDAVEVLLPHKHKIIQIGGSHAQRDVFYLLLIHAAKRSSKREHQKLASQMLHERKTQKNTPLTKMIMSDISTTPH